MYLTIDMTWHDIRNNKFNVPHTDTEIEDLYEEAKFYQVNGILETLHGMGV